MKIIPGIEGEQSALTQFMSDFFQAEFGEEILNLLAQNNVGYTELVNQLNELQQTKQEPVINSQVINQQLELIFKKINLENQRLAIYTNEEIDEEKLTDISQELVDLEKKIVTNYAIANQANAARPNDLEDKYKQKKKTLQNCCQELLEQDFSKIENFIFAKELLEEKLKAKIKEQIKNPEVQKVALPYALGLAQKELSILTATKSSASWLLEDLNTGKVHLQNHQYYAKVKEARENYLDGANGVLSLFLDNDRLINDPAILVEQSKTFAIDSEVIDWGYGILNNAINRRLDPKEFQKYLAVEDQLRADIYKYVRQANPLPGNNRNSPYNWRIATTLVLDTLDHEMNKLNLQPAVQKEETEKVR